MNGRRYVGLRALLATVVVTLAAVFAGGAPAQAQPWPVVDGFEGDHQNRWAYTRTGDGWANTDTRPEYARTGQNSATLGGASGWAAVEGWVVLDPTSSYRTCGANIYAWGNQESLLHLELIDSTTWMYISRTEKVIPKSNTKDYRQVLFQNFPHTTTRIVIRMWVGGGQGSDPNEVHLDDFYLWCSRPIG
ncbi:hypothetical protein [Phytohabitans houttuyneae]|uniref:F5/8 type C domain-containing protein n=1 Tax=Phytohabitans houttuyneae TaxID=1076126 RepID=A0A6V8KIF5_9ACTN|nr:hypothetical protein [Phytohabitans houttuyneae]GFJ81776.1 hypothetical protein Phou_059560 [Phytohabitans houttuyneae]